MAAKSAVRGSNTATGYPATARIPQLIQREIDHSDPLYQLAQNDTLDVLPIKARTLLINSGYEVLVGEGAARNISVEDSGAVAIIATQSAQTAGTGGIGASTVQRQYLAASAIRAKADTAGGIVTAKVRYWALVVDLAKNA